MHNKFIKLWGFIFILILSLSACQDTSQTGQSTIETSDTSIENNNNSNISDSSNDISEKSNENDGTISTEEEPIATGDVEVSEDNEADKTTSTFAMPTLSDLDYEDMTFKEDGYEIVEFKSLSDGDTANFVVGGMTMACRFLAIDTPETSGSTGIQPWALAAKEYTRNALENADTIILEKDLESDIIDKYDRLLAWVWVDGELLNYQLVEEGLAYVKYLYGDYKYNLTMIRLESSVQKSKIKIWGEEDPDYDYDDSVHEVSILEAKELQPGTSVTIRGTVTNYIGQNAFISDGTASIYVYANRYNYGALDDIGTEIEFTGKIIEYNGLTEVSSIVDNKITTISTDNEVIAMTIDLADINESIEGDLVFIENLIIEKVDVSSGGGYDIIVTDGNTQGNIRIDKYLEDYPDPDSLIIGSSINVKGSIGQYLESYQIMISDSSAITYN